MTPVKIVGSGEMTKKLTINGIAVSKGARAAIEKAGGTVLAFVSPAEAQVARIKKSRVVNKTASEENKKANPKEEVKKS
jgi:large subunit ribosomal protein L15